jgi:PAS domain S-box-containing protein
MPAPSLPPDEAHRLQVLLDLNILDTPPEERFDRITRLASRLFDVPIALVSLIDADRQWFKSRVGLRTEQTDRSVSFCAHAILHDTVMIVEDARRDERFATNPLVVGGPHIRFYAGYPLAAPDGSKLGTLCLIDRAPRQFSDDEGALLKDLASIVANEVAAFELNRALQQQRDSEVWMGALLEHVPEGVVMLDREGVVLTFNPAAERIFGAAAVTMIGRPARELLIDDLDLLRESLQSGGLTPHEGSGRRADGTVFPIEFSVSTMYLGGQRRFAAIVRDISRRREADIRSRVTEERHRKYFTTATHELRTPMASVLGFSELLLKRDFDAETGRELVEIIHRQTSRLVSLINQMLDLARIESGGKDELDIAPLRVDDLLQQTLSGLNGLGQNHRIRVQVEEGLPALAADAAKMQQALTNILSNSIKYSKEDSTIEVSAAAADCEGSPGVALRVRDHGVGMTAEQLTHIFDAFYRAGQMPNVQGSGLGMTIFKEIIELHNGTVQITSHPGGGTEVSLCLPLAAAESAHG